MESLEITDQQSKAVATHPRVSLDDISKAIAEVHYCQASDITKNGDDEILTICVLKMRNGFIVIGKAAPALPENFNIDLGRKFAYENGVRQLWPLMGYALKDKLAQEK